jgi:hypothetical protein
VNKLFEQVVTDSESTPALRRQRSAALVLHSMSEADRAWALAELSEEERGVLRPLIDELQALGVPADTDWVSSALGTPAPVARSRGREASDPVHRKVARALPEQVVAVLQDEPVELVRRLLGLSSWPWKTEVIAALNTRRGELFDAAPALALSQPPSALDRAALTRFAGQLSGSSHRSQADAIDRSLPGNSLRGWLRSKGLMR